MLAVALEGESAHPPTEDPSMPSSDSRTDALLGRVAAGDGAAAAELLGRHRDRLKQMVRARIDPRLARRVDPSDVVQDVLLVAARKVGDYAASRPLPFYPWLRQLALRRLIDLERRHIQAARRSVRLEERPHPQLSDASLNLLARRLLSRELGPVSELVQRESRRKLHETFARLEERDREILLLRYLEGLDLSEAAAVLSIAPNAARMRHLRALQRLRELIGSQDSWKGT
jgi:RNA polymerase sigma-70 factor (ECF subfamily)